MKSSIKLSVTDLKQAPLRGAVLNLHWYKLVYRILVYVMSNILVYLGESIVYCLSSRPLQLLENMKMLILYYILYLYYIMEVNSIFPYRFDLLFSYWIFVWYLLYIFEIVDASPKLALILGLFENLTLLYSMIFIQSQPLKTVIIFVMINTCFKVIPLYTLYDEKINLKKDIQNTAVLFIFYIIWLIILNHNVKKVRENLLQLFSKSHKISAETTPGTALILDIEKQINRFVK